MAARNQKVQARLAAAAGAVALAALIATLIWTDSAERLNTETDRRAHQLDEPSEPPREAPLDETNGVPVLCYHYFRPAWSAVYAARVVGAVVLNLPTLGVRDFWTIPIGEFERHLRLLREKGTRFLTLDEVHEIVRAGRPLPNPAVVITIDDADESVYSLAWPVLKRQGVRAHLFVPTARVGQEWNGLRLCTWSQLNEMSASGAVIVESHTHDLHWKVPGPHGYEPVFLQPRRLAAADSAANAGEAAGRRLPGGFYSPVARDLWQSRRAIETHTGRPPGFVAWPYGFASAALDSVASACGFTGSLSLKPWAWRENGTSWHIGRYAMTAKTTPAALFDLLPPAIDRPQPAEARP